MTWLEKQFEFEWCSECGGGAEDHIATMVLGNCHAWCKHPISEGLSDHDFQAELNRRIARKDDGLPLVENEHVAAC